MSDYDPIDPSTDLDCHGLAPGVEPDPCAQSGGYGMEEVGLSCMQRTHGSSVLKSNTPLESVRQTAHRPLE